MKSRYTLFSLYLVLLSILLALSLLYYQLYPIGHMQTSTPGEPYKSPVLGGFSIDTPKQAMNASAEGIQVAFDDDPPTQEGIMGKTLQSSQMRVVDGLIARYLHYYECHRTRMRQPLPAGFNEFCRDDNYPSLTNESVLFSLITKHLQEVKDNPLIIGYWVLDDWLLGDPGSARPLLVRIHQLIEHYTPERFAICGFGGFIHQGNAYDWKDEVAANFSPQGCDRVGLYIYGPSELNTVPPSPSNTYNWSMSGLLTEAFNSLIMRGWNIAKEPLIGIGQAFGGPIKNTQEYWITPSTDNIETQSRSFCTNGATGLVFYAWMDSGYGQATQTPMNSPEIETGIQRGIADFHAYWDKPS